MVASNEALKNGESISKTVNSQVSSMKSNNDKSTEVNFSCSATGFGVAGIVYYPEQEDIVALTETQLKTLRADAEKHQKVMDVLQKSIKTADELKSADGKNKKIAAAEKDIAKAKEDILAHLKKLKIVGKSEADIALKELIDLEKGKHIFVNNNTLQPIIEKEYSYKNLFPLSTKKLEVIAASKNENDKKIDLKSEITKPDKKTSPNPDDDSIYRTIVRADPKQLTSLLIDVYKDVNKNLKGKLNCDVYTNGIIDFGEPFTKWVESVEKQLAFPEKWKEGQTKYFDYTANAGVSLMRYYAGVGGSAEFNLKEAKLSVKGEGRVDFTLIDARVKTQLMIPSKEGFELKISNYADINKNPEKEPEFVITEHKIPDTNFETARSFLQPSFIKTLQKISIKLEREESSRLRLVGHTDTVGNSSYNQNLSVRRVHSIYAFITNDVNKWNEIRKIEGWSYKEAKYMLSSLAEKNSKYKPGPLSNKRNTAFVNAITAFKRNRGISTRADLDASTWTQLITEYMSGSRDVDISASSFVANPLIGRGESDLKEDTGQNVNSEANRRVTFEILSPKEPEDMIHLGHLKCVIELELFAFAGANIVAGVDLDVSLGNAKITEDLKKKFKKDGGKEGEETATELKLRGIQGDSSNKESMLYDYDAREQDYYKNTSRTSSSLEKGLNKKEKSIVYGSTDTTQNIDRFNEVKVVDGKVNAAGELKDNVTNTTQVSKMTTTSNNKQVSGSLKAIKASSSKTTENQTNRSNTTEKTTTVNGKAAYAPVTAKAGVRVNAFAGAQAGGKGTATLFWKSVEAKSQFVDLAKIGLGCSAIAGAAIGKEFYISFEGGKFIIRVHASVAWGVGASGSVDLEVNSKNMYHFITFVYTQLRDNDFNFLNFMEEDGFEALCYALAWSLIKGNPVALGIKAGESLYNYISVNYSKWNSWWDDNAQNSNLVNDAIKNIKQNRELIKYLPSEARANVLDTLCLPVDGVHALATWFDGSEDDFQQDKQWNKLNLVDGLNEPQETAILKVLKWVQSKNDLDNILLHMGKPLPNKRKLSTLSNDAKKERRKVNVNRIYAILDGGQKEQFRTYWSKLEADAQRLKNETDPSKLKSYLPETSKIGPVRQVL